MSELPHILVVDDDTRLRELLSRYLGENGFRVTVARDAADARAQMAGLSFDALVLDVMMPGETGLDLTRTLRADSAVPILLLTAMSEADDRIGGFESGADDYLVKPFEPRELVLRLKAVLRRAQPEAPPAIVALGALTFDLARAELSKGGVAVRLTGAEASLLKVFADNPGRTLTRHELIRRSRIEGNDRTVDVQITRLRRKIEPDPRMPRYLQTVRGEGYVLRPD
jgi:two-component system, OmpR family, phosphate regulon response regulator OmpR